MSTTWIVIWVAAYTLRSIGMNGIAEQLGSFLTSGWMISVNQGHMSRGLGVGDALM